MFFYRSSHRCSLLEALLRPSSWTGQVGIFSGDGFSLFLMHRRCPDFGCGGLIQVAGSPSTSTSEARLAVMGSSSFVVLAGTSPGTGVVVICSLLELLNRLGVGRIFFISCDVDFVFFLRARRQLVQRLLCFAGGGLRCSPTASTAKVGGKVSCWTRGRFLQP
ncbi:hypothetical protein BRADI_1g62857v3 [Brachypodium distachyon]|uniref:Uncharacterized protein n=1 Tax=Brachypodium distachyon TaxID=15368 RepID=A0A2K2DT32_BRADI|nr:hypothetical protein BRADI_1g62857v3 [Brachypodium distachyon]